MAGTPEPAPVEVSQLVAIHMDGQRLLLPQWEVFSVESVLDVKPEGAPPPAAGVIELVGEEWPVYCLSGEGLTPTMDFPSQRRICLLLNDDHHRLAIACDQIEALEHPPRLHYPLPPCLARPDALVELLVIHEEAIGCVTTTARLGAYCQRGMNQGLGNG